MRRQVPAAYQHFVCGPWHASYLYFRHELPLCFLLHSPDLVSVLSFLNGEVFPVSLLPLQLFQSDFLHLDLRNMTSIASSDITN